MQLVASASVRGSEAKWEKRGSAYHLCFGIPDTLNIY